MNISRQKAVFLVVAFLLVVGVSAVSFFHSLYRDVRSEVAMTKSGATVERIREKFLELSTPIQRDLELLAQWGESGQVDMDDIPSLNSKFIPLLSLQPFVVSLILADTDGREYFLLKQENGWMVRRAGSYRPDMKATIDQLDKNGLETETGRIDRSFDPRTRPWFAGALQSETKGTVYWTKPYTFKTLSTLGITASIKWQADHGKGRITVAAMDVSMDMLRKFLSEIEVTSGAQVVLIRNDGMMMTASPKAGTGDDGADFLGLHGLPDGLKKDALSLWSGLKEDQTATRPFVSQGSPWWASFQPLQPESPTLWIGVLIPEADLVSHMDSWWIPFALKFGGGVIGLALVVGVFVWRYSLRNDEQTGPSVNDETSLKALIQSGESVSVEFKSTVRTNLKSGKKDKAIELAWLKGVTAFMNSGGGTLLLGVSDDGTICGIAADEFENDDKCFLHVKNLLHEHIGSEFAGLVQCRLIAADGQTVACLSCRKSEIPVFLKVGKNEDFFVRSGPSSTKLSMSQMVSYLEQRK